ncbi:terminase [Limosilactobacillus reuteri]|uniref:Terminase n=2 Tax=Limosilactobacillus reuteri TaxID=1598 RepID=A0ABD6Y7F5_LIMRT|nr:terminase [Limosilactobacillus reuteri]
MYIAARGQGKSFLIAIYCVIRCILYPGTSIVIASGTRGQAAKIISEKIVRLYNDCPAVRYEIGDRRNIKDSFNDSRVEFPNGSKIQAVTSNDNSRGLRCNILIVDEFRMVKKEIVDKVLKPMLNVSRRPGFMARPEYENYPTESNKEIYISSAWFKSHWIWDEFKKYVKEMVEKNNKDYFVALLPYQLSMRHHLLEQKRIDNERSADNFDQTGFDMEYEAIFVGENDKAYFKLDPLNKIRTVNKTFIPPTSTEYVENKMRSKPRVLSNFKRVDRQNEIRIVSLDIALMGGNKLVKNDTSAFTLMRLIRQKDEYQRQVVYLESIQKSISSEDLAIRLKQLYYDFEADYVVMDANGNGLGVFDACTTVLTDKERDVEYPPWACINDDETNDRTKTKGMRVVYTVKASAAFNHEIAVSLKSVIENGKLRLPMNDIQKREELQEDATYRKLSPEDQVRRLYPYIQATALVNELVNLEYTVRAGLIKIYEVGTTTKDRYSSIAYCNYYANELEKSLREEDGDTLEYFMI